MNNNIDTIKFFAGFAQGTESVDTENTGGIKRFLGIAPLSLVFINPTLKELKEIFPDYQGTEPEYKTIKDGKETGLRVNLWFKLDKEHKDVKGKIDPEKEYYMNTSIFLGNDYFFNKDKTKVKVLNNYGESAWVNTEMIKNQELPEYAKNNGFLLPYRPCFVNEDLLIDTIKAYLQIPITKKFDKEMQGFVLKNNDELKKCECYFDDADVKQILKGDVTIIKGAFAQQKDNKIKYFLAIRTTDDNKEYQEIINRYPMSYNVKENGINKVIKNIKADIEAGAYSSVNFDNFNIEFRIKDDKPTEFAQAAQPVDDLPWN